MKPKQVDIMGMPLDEWQYEGCIAHFGVGDNWATLYDIQSKEEGKGHATHLLLLATKYYETKNKKVGGSVALNPRMATLYKKVGIEEYK